jgi:ABC-type multidrug transport system ATPase subunit
MLKRLKQQGITILVSTPYMDEANLCDRIALIQQGAILDINTPQEMIANYPGNLFKVTEGNQFALLHDLRNYPSTEHCFAFGDSLHLIFKATENEDLTAVNRYLESHGHQGFHIDRTEPTIEDCFIHYLQH